MSEPSPPSPRSEPPGARLVFVLGAICALFWIFTLLADRAEEVQVTLIPNEVTSLKGLEQTVRAEAERVPALTLGSEVDDTAAIERLAARSPAAVARARAAHVRFVAVAGEDLHALFARLVQRLVVLDPDWAIHLGRHPHPTGATVVGDETRARYLCLVQDAWRLLRAWPAGDRHQVTDRALVRAILETSLRWDLASRDQDLLRYPEEWFVPLVTLSTVECCPPEVRRQVAIARLRAIAPQLVAFADQLRAPPRAVLESVLRRFGRIRAFLAELPRAWPSPDHADGLGEAIAITKAALSVCEARLRTEVLPRATGRLGVGANNYALILTRVAFLNTTPRAVLREAVEAFSAARKELSALKRPGLARPKPAQHDARAELAKHLARIGSAATRIVAKGSTPPAPRIALAPALWRDEAGEVFLFPPGPLAPPVRSTLFVTPDPHAPTPLYALHLEHALARSVAPGTHLQRTLARAACDLRRVYDCKLNQRGWSAYAEELLHTTTPPGCGPSPADAYMRASTRLTQAWVTILEVLLHTRAVPPERLLALLRQYENNPDLTLADLGFRAREAGLASTEFLGLRALRALHAGQTDLPGFRRRYLESGPVPPTLLAIELQAPR